MLAVQKHKWLDFESETRTPGRKEGRKEEKEKEKERGKEKGERGKEKGERRREGRGKGEKGKGLPKKGNLVLREAGRERQDESGQGKRTRRQYCHRHAGGPPLRRCTKSQNKKVSTQIPGRVRCAEFIFFLRKLYASAEQGIRGAVAILPQGRCLSQVWPILCCGFLFATHTVGSWLIWTFFRQQSADA